VTDLTEIADREDTGPLRNRCHLEYPKYYDSEEIEYSRIGAIVPYYGQEGIDTLGLAVELLRELVTGFGKSTIKLKLETGRKKLLCLSREHRH
jgi:hypothetical protein